MHVFTWSTSLGLTNDPLLSLNSTCKVINNKIKSQSFMYEPKQPLSLVFKFPGDACFICESDHNLGDIGSMTISDCPRCSPTITLDLSQGQCILQHIGSYMIPPSFKQLSLSVAYAYAHRNYASSIWKKKEVQMETCELIKGHQRAVSSRWTTLTA